MHIFPGVSSGLLGLCATAVLLACSETVIAASGTVEVDLLFPQNDTYAPAPIIPVAFAFQKSELAGYLQPLITFQIFPYQNDSGHNVADGYFDMAWTSFSSSTPYLQYGAAIEGLNREGIWTLIWELDYVNCSNSGDLKVGAEGTRHQITFTTKNGAKKPDLTAATSEDTCSKSDSVTIQITETYDSGGLFKNGLPCPVLAETTPSPNPCAVKIDASAAANVSASLTSRWCAVKSSTWCPEPDKGAASDIVGPSLVVGGVALFAAAIGGLGFLVM